MTFTEEQKAHVKKQLQANEHDAGTRTIILGDNTSIDLLIERDVFGSDIMSSGIYLARFLYQHQELYAGKDCVDIGCGAGTQGIIMSKYGARSVVLSDINPSAVANARKNIEQQDITNAEIYESDLFESLPKNRTYDVIVFNHPFFSGEPEELEGNDMLKRSMLGGTQLIERFFQEAPQVLRQNGIIIMPYFHFAGIENEPGNHSKGLTIQEYKIESQEGLQKGKFSIYVIVN